MPTNTAEPIERIGGIPVYKHGTAPAFLRSKSQLRAGLRLRLAPGQRPVCYVIPHWHPDERRALYDPADAIPVEDQRIGSVWAWRQRRTCPKCGIVREHVVHGLQCGVCWRAEQRDLAARQERRCDGCRRIGDKPYPEVKEGWYRKRYCRACRADRRRTLDAMLREAIYCPGGCGKRTATKRQILDWCEARHYSIARFGRRYCPPCQVVHDAEVEQRNAEQQARWEKERAEERAREEAERARRRQELADLREWAIEVLADPATVILDTETTGLDDDARIVEISITTAAGDVLLDTLVNPGKPIPAEASGIHGITDAMVGDAPTFAAILPDLEAAIRGKRVLIYNESYDTARLLHEYQRRCAAQTMYYSGPDDEPAAVAKRWLAKFATEDAMEPYSAWYGDWSDYWGNYRWQRLGGGHRALGDCLAVIDCLKSMARPSVYEDEETAS